MRIVPRRSRALVPLLLLLLWLHRDAPHRLLSVAMAVPMIRAQPRARQGGDIQIESVGTGGHGVRGAGPKGDVGGGRGRPAMRCVVGGQAAVVRHHVRWREGLEGGVVVLAEGVVGGVVVQDNGGDVFDGLLGAQFRGRTWQRCESKRGALWRVSVPGVGRPWY